MRVFFSWLLVFLFLLSGCSFVAKNGGKQKVTTSQYETKTTNNTPSSKAESVISLPKKYLQITPFDKVILTTDTLHKGDRVKNVTTGQIGIVTGEIVVVLKKNQRAPQLAELKKHEKSDLLISYIVMSSDVDLLGKLKELQDIDSILSIELQVTYPGTFVETY
ncbi:hypothetical protein CWB96_06150 [Pseudoalteromonas citrea]|uniref:Flagellar biosynthesis protein FlgP n=1 Tax=Pseudoalteromonas citrea TaxID=43655 RepID=A0A5S3XRX5_9GAMM|nr:hypothetical protein [Pseudoalteromonas citrea]TMP44332.1 hypothetical protein CWB97_06515 [Pseudoalteromonas citrea]TMP60773.1 hypothetical protein CWB96_06150 [Pseudoalteromonas citrea]